MSSRRWEWVKGIRGAWLVLIGKAWALHYYSVPSDDRSAVTFWLPKSKDRREQLAKAFETMAARVRQCS